MFSQHNVSELVVCRVSRDDNAVEAGLVDVLRDERVLYALVTKLHGNETNRCVCACVRARASM